MLDVILFVSSFSETSMSTSHLYLFQASVSPTFLSVCPRSPRDLR